MAETPDPGCLLRREYEGKAYAEDEYAILILRYVAKDLFPMGQKPILLSRDFK